MKSLGQGRQGARVRPAQSSPGDLFASSHGTAATTLIGCIREESVERLLERLTAEFSGVGLAFSDLGERITSPILIRTSTTACTLDSRNIPPLRDRPFTGSMQA